MCTKPHITYKNVWFISLGAFIIILKYWNFPTKHWKGYEKESLTLMLLKSFLASTILSTTKGQEKSSGSVVSLEFLWQDGVDWILQLSKEDRGVNVKNWKWHIWAALMRHLQAWVSSLDYASSSASHESKPQCVLVVSVELQIDYSLAIVGTLKSKAAVHVFLCKPWMDKANEKVHHTTVFIDLQYECIRVYTCVHTRLNDLSRIFAGVFFNKVILLDSSVLLLSYFSIWYCTMITCKKNLTAEKM